MEEKPQFSNFLDNVDIFYKKFVTELHDYLNENKAKMTIKMAKNGYVVSYSHAGNKKVIFNYVFRKSGIIMRIYADNLNNYIDVIASLPEKVLKKALAAGDCKRLLDPTKCSSHCAMGYDFIIDNIRYKKCRFNCFMIPLNDENMPHLRQIIENEVSERNNKTELMLGGKSQI